MGTGWLSPYGLGDPADRGLTGGSARCPASRERVRPRMDTSPGKDARSESRGGFLLSTYPCHTVVKSKTCKLRAIRSQERPRSRKDVKAGGWDSVSADLVVGRHGGSLSVYHYALNPTIVRISQMGNSRWSCRDTYGTISVAGKGTRDDTEVEITPKYYQCQCGILYNFYSHYVFLYFLKILQRHVFICVLRRKTSFRGTQFV